MHEFIGDQQVEILARSLRTMQRATPELDGVTLAAGLGAVLEEIRRALRRNAGLVEVSGLASDSEAAARFGHTRLQLGLPIDAVVEGIGSLFDGMSTMGAERGLSFTASEYLVFGRGLDTAIANAVDRYWQESRALDQCETAARSAELAHELRDALAAGTVALSLVRAGHAGLEGRMGDVLARSLARIEWLVTQTMLGVVLDRELARSAARPGC